MPILPVTTDDNAPPPSFSMEELARALDGTLVGDGHLRITRAVHPKEACKSGDLVVAMSAALLEEAQETANVPGQAILTHGDLSPDARRWQSCLKIARPRLALSELTKLFANSAYVTPGIHPTAIVAQTARIAPDARIGAYVVIGPRVTIDAGTVIMPAATIGRGSTIGKDCIVHTGVRICEHVKIGDRVILHPNCVIGGDGFSFVTPEPGSVESAKTKGSITGTNTELRRIASLGGVVISDDVEIGCNSTIDRGTLRATTIGRNTKIDNQVQVGHNVQIGENCLLCGLVGIAGSAIIGNRVVLGGQSGVSDHCKIGDDTVVGGGAGVATNIHPKNIVVGTPAQPREKYAKQFLYLGRLPHLFERIEKLEARIKELEKLEETG